MSLTTAKVHSWIHSDWAVLLSIGSYGCRNSDTLAIRIKWPIDKQWAGTVVTRILAHLYTKIVWNICRPRCGFNSTVFLTCYIVLLVFFIHHCLVSHVLFSGLHSHPTAIHPWSRYAVVPTTGDPPGVWLLRDFGWYLVRGVHPGRAEVCMAERLRRVLFCTVWYGL